MRAKSFVVRLLLLTAAATCLASCAVILGLEDEQLRPSATDGEAADGDRASDGAVDLDGASDGDARITPGTDAEAGSHSDGSVADGDAATNPCSCVNATTKVCSGTTTTCPASAGACRDLTGQCYEPRWSAWKMPNEPGAAPNPAQFAVTAETVTDLVTGLVWQRTAGPNADWLGAQTYCTSLALGGVTGWRVPARIELASILDVSIPQGYAIDKTTFLGTTAGFTWTSVTAAADATKAWQVGFSAGSLGTAAKDSFNQVRCVR